MKYTFFILLLTIPIASGSSRAPDDSIKLIQEWADGLQAAVKNEDKPAIASFFANYAIFRTCEHTNSSSRPYEVNGYQGENLVNLFAKPNPKLAIHVMSSHYQGREKEYAVAFLVITGFGDPIAQDHFFFTIDEKARFKFGEYLPCGWAEVNCRKTCE